MTNGHRSANRAPRRSDLQLRPEWSAKSLKTYLEAKHADRAFADLAVALVMVAVDPTSTTPARIEAHGPRWLATRFNVGNAETQTPGPGREPACDRPGHEHELARNCRACAAERLAETEPATPGPVIPAPEGLLPRPTRKPRTDQPRDFASTIELRQPSRPSRCAKCEAVFVDDEPGREAHRAVFGHTVEPLAVSQP